MSGEDAPRPYLENLIVGATRNKNKQLSSHITTTSRRQHTRRRVITPRVKARAPNPASVPLVHPPDTPCQSPSTKSRICALGPATRHPVSKPEHQILHLCPWPSHPTPRVKARAPNPASVPLVHPPDTPCQSPSTKSRICALGPATRPALAASQKGNQEVQDTRLTFLFSSCVGQKLKDAVGSKLR
jgi:hypothetical protein